jgi:putative ABC transport system substrate-binding protein
VLARAQQPPTPVIGWLSSASNAPPGGPERTPKGFRAGLNEAGYFVGRNVIIEVFLANGRYNRLPALADEMVRRQVNLIVASGGLPSARAALAAGRILKGADPGELPVQFRRPSSSSST